MNSLKTVVMLAFLGAIGYVVYSQITYNPRRADDLPAAPAFLGNSANAPPGAAPEAFTAGGPPSVSLPSGVSSSAPIGVLGPTAADPTAPSGEQAAPPPTKVLPSPRDAVLSENNADMRYPATDAVAPSYAAPTQSAAPPTGVDAGRYASYPASSASDQNASLAPGDRYPASAADDRYATGLNAVAPRTSVAAASPAPANDGAAVFYPTTSDPAAPAANWYSEPTANAQAASHAPQGGGFASTSAPPSRTETAAKPGEAPGTTGIATPASYQDGAAGPSAAEQLAQLGVSMATIRAMLEAGQLDRGLVALSQIYELEGLSESQRSEIREVIGQVAGTVVYSGRHLLEPPYCVRPGETLAQVAEQYQVPVELLARINGLEANAALAPGQELKVVRGPFEAVVHLDRGEMVLFVQGRYAGRFPIRVGRDQPKLEGTYIVRKKVANPVYYGPDGVTIAAGDPRNPLGHGCLELSGGVSVHGTNDPQGGDGRGMVSLAEPDIADAMTILSIGSRVTIAR